MRIISMIATFGKLDGDTLTLEPGLNVFHAPNEWGKSTWCAFLTAMLYGVETRERNTRGAMADKERYAPWSGKPMEGMLRVEHEGRDITIQRRARGRVPLGSFEAFETRTGMAVPELTAENCGRVLLGVEKSVFQRTGFIRFSDLTVIPDEALWQRLHALVTTGDESGSAAALGKKLKDLKNKCRSSRGGLIPEAERRLRELQDQCREREALEQQCAGLEQQAQEINEEMELLERHHQVCLYREAKENKEQIQAAVEAARDARDACQELEERCADLPRREELEDRIAQARVHLEVLQGESAEGGPTVAGILVRGMLAVLALALAVVFLFRQMVLWGAVMGAAALMLGILTGRAADRRRSLALRRRLDRNKRDRQAAEVSRDIHAWSVQLMLYEQLDTARTTAEQTRIRLQSLVSVAKEAARTEQEDDLALTREETVERMAELTRQLRTNRQQLGQCQGRMEFLSELEQLADSITRTQNRIRELERYERALTLALEKMEEASRSLKRRFAPQITERTRIYLERLTNGRYNRVSIGEDLSILAANETETTLRPSQWRSDGTVDAMYLALRLAVWVVLNPDGPLVVDDALLRLDEERLACAMELLGELAQHRQIVVFSCRKLPKG